MRLGLASAASVALHTDGHGITSTPTPALHCDPREQAEVPAPSEPLEYTHVRRGGSGGGGGGAEAGTLAHVWELGGSGGVARALACAEQVFLTYKQARAEGQRKKRAGEGAAAARIDGPRNPAGGAAAPLAGCCPSRDPRLAHHAYAWDRTHMTPSLLSGGQLQVTSATVVVCVDLSSEPGGALAAAETWLQAVRARLAQVYAVRPAGSARQQLRAAEHHQMSSSPGPAVPHQLQSAGHWQASAHPNAPPTAPHPQAFERKGLQLPAQLRRRARLHFGDKHADLPALELPGTRQCAGACYALPCATCRCLLLSASRVCVLAVAMVRVAMIIRLPSC